VVWIRTALINLGATVLPGATVPAATGPVAVTQNYEVTVNMGGVQATTPAQAQGLADYIAGEVLQKISVATRVSARGAVA
jgi:hypothetical protein